MIVRFDSLPRPIVDGRETGFCKLIVDRERHRILGCHIVGERVVELAQATAIVMSGEMPVEKLALVPFSFPTYANALGRGAIAAAIELDDTGMSALDHLGRAEGGRNDVRVTAGHVSADQLEWASGTTP